MNVKTWGPDGVSCNQGKENAVYNLFDPNTDLFTLLWVLYFSGCVNEWASERVRGTVREIACRSCRLPCSRGKENEITFSEHGEPFDIYTKWTSRLLVLVLIIL